MEKEKFMITNVSVVDWDFVWFQFFMNLFLLGATSYSRPECQPCIMEVLTSGADVPGILRSISGDSRKSSIV